MSCTTQDSSTIYRLNFWTSSRSKSPSTLDILHSKLNMVLDLDILKKSLSLNCMCQPLIVSEGVVKFFRDSLSMIYPSLSLLFEKVYSSDPSRMNLTYRQQQITVYLGAESRIFWAAGLTYLSLSMQQPLQCTRGAVQQMSSNFPIDLQQFGLILRSWGVHCQMYCRTLLWTQFRIFGENSWGFASTQSRIPLNWQVSGSCGSRLRNRVLHILLKYSSLRKLEFFRVCQNLPQMVMNLHISLGSKNMAISMISSLGSSFSSLTDCLEQLCCSWWTSILPNLFSYRSRQWRMISSVFSGFSSSCWSSTPGFFIVSIKVNRHRTIGSFHSQNCRSNWMSATGATLKFLPSFLACWRESSVSSRFYIKNFKVFDKPQYHWIQVTENSVSGTLRPNIIFGADDYCLFIDMEQSQRPPSEAQHLNEFEFAHEFTADQQRQMRDIWAKLNAKKESKAPSKIADKTPQPTPAFAPTASPAMEMNYSYQRPQQPEYRHEPQTISERSGDHTDHDESGDQEYTDPKANPPQFETAASTDHQTSVHRSESPSPANKEKMQFLTADNVRLFLENRHLNEANSKLKLENGQLLQENKLLKTEIMRLRGELKNLSYNTVSVEAFKAEMARMASHIAAEKQKTQKQGFLALSPMGIGQQRMIFQQPQQIHQPVTQHHMGNNQLLHQIGTLRQQLIMERQERANRQRLLQQSKQMLERQRDLILRLQSLEQDKKTNDAYISDLRLQLERAKQQPRSISENELIPKLENELRLLRETNTKLLQQQAKRRAQTPQGDRERQLRNAKLIYEAENNRLKRELNDRDERIDELLGELGQIKLDRSESLHLEALQQ